MTDMHCGYSGDRDEALIAYLYDEIEPAIRAAFDAHLGTCMRCRAELDALGRVRTQLARWAPPEPGFVVASDQSRFTGAQSSVSSLPSTADGQSWWKEVPAWAQVAAALLFLGVSAGIANLDVRYDRQGLVIRTGWSTPGAPPQQAAAPGFLPASKADVAALEQQLRTELRAVHAPATGPVTVAARPASSDAEILRRVRALVDESERRQQSELALRVGSVVRDVNRLREADLVRIDRNLGQMQNTLGVEVLKNRQSVNYLMRVNQRQ